MKILTILLSITVGILSVVLFKEHFIETATTLYNNLSILTTATNRNNTTSNETMAAKASIPRAIRKAFLAVEQAEGAGARVRRSIGTPQLKNFSPFLMLDHFSVKPGAGFPDHPHRGQEVCYLSPSHPIHARQPPFTHSIDLPLPSHPNCSTSTLLHPHPQKKKG